MKYPFEATQAKILKSPDVYIDSVFASLSSEFMVMPRGEGFVTYPIFEAGYEALKQGTGEFSFSNSDGTFEVITRKPIAFVVLRAILGISPPEWAYLASQAAGKEITQGFIRSLDRKIRSNPDKPIRLTAEVERQLRALIKTAGKLIQEGAPPVANDQIHRLDKADTKNGVAGLNALAQMGVPYAMLLYERFLGRPFAGHRDSVSELVGDRLESAIENVLLNAHISARKTKRAEKIEGFDQTPDFIIPDEFNPQVVIEAKITEDDGTARDKVTRIQHLGQMAERKGKAGFEVIACIGGRGFGVRREDMKKMLLATRGKVFTFQTLDRLVACSRLKEFASK
jgi:hypothetical protein